MSLFVEQLVHTSFAGGECRTLASEKMPQVIQQAFMKSVVAPYLENPDFVDVRMSAAYVHQISTDELLLGWLYRDESPQNPAELVSHFVCYYSTQAPDASQLELIFDCLEKGPATSVEGLENLTTLDPLILLDSGDYESKRSGVLIPSSVRAVNRLLLYKKKLLHCFVPFEEPRETQEPQQNPIVELDSSPTIEVDALVDHTPPVLTRKYALLIGVSEYALGVQPLPGVEKDLEAMKRALSNRQIGNFTEVETLLNPDTQVMAEKIENFLANCPSDSLALLYFSGYGVLDSEGTLCLSTASSRSRGQRKIIRSTYVSTDFLGAVMRESPSVQQVLILDVCLSEDDPLNNITRTKNLNTFREQLSGSDRSILMSSSAIHNPSVQKGTGASVYTAFLVEGLETGMADANGNGIITLAEWHTYAKYKAQLTSPALRPALYGQTDQRQLPLAQAPLNDVKLRYRREVERSYRNGQISLVRELILNDLQKTLGITPSESAKIKVEVLKPYQDYQNKLRKYALHFLNQVHQEMPVKTLTNSQIVYLQDSLGLTDDDTDPIKVEICQQLNAIQLPGTVSSPLLAGAGQAWQTKLGVRFQGSSALQSSLAKFAGHADSLKKEIQDRLPTQLKPSSSWTKQLNRTLLNRGVLSIGVLTGLIGLFVISTSLFSARQKQEQQRSLQKLQSLVQERKYDECMTLSQSFPQDFRQSTPVQKILDQCQLGLPWQTIATHVFPQSSARSQMLAFQPESQMVASGNEDGTIQLWNTAKQTFTRTLAGHPKQLRSIAFSRNGSWLASAGSDKTVKLWDISTGRLVHQFKGHRSAVWSVASLPNSNLIASGSEDSTIKLWNISTGKLDRTLNSGTGAIRAIATGPDDKTLISAGSDPAITVWNLETGKPALKLAGHTERVIALAMSQDGQRLASASADKTIKVWTADGKLLRTLPDTLATPQTLTFSPDHKTLVAGIGNSLRLWNVETGQFLYQYSDSANPVNAATFSPNGRMLAIAHQNKPLKLLKLK
jgi:hypothetical protein